MLLLDELGFFECFESAVLCYGAKTFGRDGHGHGLFNFWYVNTSLLEIRSALGFARRIKLSRTGTVTVLAADLCLLAGNVANFCHIDKFSSGILPRMVNIASAHRDVFIFLCIIEPSMEPLTIALIIGLVISIVLHEVGHAYAANWLGDPTARLEGRLSVNPIVHIDPFMSVIVPGLLVLSGSPFLFGAAKPVPYNPYNFTNQKWGEAIVAGAGPLVNIVLAIIFAVVVQIGAGAGMSETFLYLAAQLVVMNLFLAVFNLMPIPPLDGSKILPRFLPFSLRMQYETFRRYLEQNALLAFGLVIFLFVAVLGDPLYSIVLMLAQWLIG